MHDKHIYIKVETTADRGSDCKIPIIQGGMGVGISRSHLAGAVAKEGGVGIISTAQIGYDEEGFENDQAGCNLKAIKNISGKQRSLPVETDLWVSILWLH